MDVQRRDKKDVERLGKLMSQEPQAKQRDRFRIALLTVQGFTAE